MTGKCNKCGGYGVIPAYSHHSGGVCFECGGSGKARAQSRLARLRAMYRDRCILEHAGPEQIESLPDATLARLCALAAELAGDGYLDQERLNIFTTSLNGRKPTRGELNEAQIRFMIEASPERIAKASQGQRERILVAAKALADAGRISTDRLAAITRAVNGERP